jgi:hypothetical protein
MTTYQERKTSLPLRGDLTPNYILSIIIAVLMTAASIAGIFFQTETYPSDDLLGALLPSDVSILFIGLPMMLVSMGLAWRGRLIGLLLWPGALIFVLYSYLTYIFAMPLNVALLLQLTLVMLCVYSLISLVASIDSTAIKPKLAGNVSERLSGGILAGLGILFFSRAMVVLASAIINQESITEVELALNCTDFLIAPAWVICGVQLWRRKAFGYVTNLGMLYQASMLFIGLILVLLLQPIISDAPLPLVDVVVVFVMGLICFVPFGLYVRGVISS